MSIDSFEETINKLNKSKLEKLYEELEQKYLVALFLFNDRKNMLDVLSSNDNVREYIKYKEEENKLQNIMNSLNDKMRLIAQRLCKHDNIFIYDEISEMNGNNKIYSCKCLNCEKEMFLNNKDINKVSAIKATTESPKSLDEYWSIKRNKDNKRLKRRLKK